MSSLKKICSVNPRIVLTVISLALLVILPLSIWSINPVIAQGKKAPKMTWVRVGTGNCAGHDVGNSDGFTPDDKQAKAGYTAYCFDGRIFDVDRGRVFCTYKNIAPNKCTGGSPPGVIYKAVSR